jgi:hypothetical protein
MRGENLVGSSIALQFQIACRNANCLHIPQPTAKKPPVLSNPCAAIHPGKGDFISGESGVLRRRQRAS